MVDLPILLTEIYCYKVQPYNTHRNCMLFKSSAKWKGCKVLQGKCRVSYHFSNSATVFICLFQCLQYKHLLNIFCIFTKSLHYILCVRLLSSISILFCSQTLARGGGHDCAVITHSPPTSTACRSNTETYVGKLVVAY